LEQVQSLRDLATKATSTLSDVPPSGSRNVHRMEDIITKMIDLENEINGDIDKLVDLKSEITSVINGVENTTYRVLLELRYLCLKTWEEIAAEMNYDCRYLLKVHGKALKAVDTKRQ
jgi:hypothetical protein